MFITIVNFLSAIVAIAIFAWYLHYYRWARRVKGIRGPSPIPILGNALEIRGRSSILSDFSRLCQRYGRTVKLMIGTQPFINVADYDVLANILSSSKLIDKSPVYRFLRNWLNSGLLLSTGAKWKKRRHILTPAYHFKILEGFVPIFDRVSDILIDQIRKDKDLNAVDIYPYVKLCTLDVICETAMGVSINAQLNRQSDYVTSVNAMGKIVVDRRIRPWEQNDWTYRYTKNYHIEQKCLKVLHNFTKSVIAKRRQELALEERNDVQIKDGNGTKMRLAFLDLLLRSSENGVPFADDDIQEEVDTFMFEGHDTTASAISFAIYSIANNPNVQAKIVAEQEAILGDELRMITCSDLNQMRYLDMVIKETLRLYPPVPLFSRQNKEDLKLGNGMIIPAGTTIALLPFEIHRDPEYFPDPNKFDPDRFLAENNIGKKPFSYIPFSAGPRNCIGQRFAILAMKSTISKIIRHFELSPTVPVHKLEIVAETILKSRNGIVIKMRDRRIRHKP